MSLLAPRLIALAALAVLALALPGPSRAVEAGGSSPLLPAQRFVTKHQRTIHDQRVSYTATVEEFFIADAEGRRAASIMATSYVRTGVRDAATRPLVFVFNGGPGSASLWLHMGLVGPRRVLLDDSDTGGEEIHPRTTPPFRIVDNPDSLLDVADLVLFDPPGTGFSRILDGGKPSQFYGVQQDARVTAAFIQDWIARHDRRNAPRFLMGESYGSIRAAVVARLLSGGPTSTGRMDAVTLNGVILLGQAMDMTRGDADRQALTSLPTLAASAWYHHKVDRTQATLEQHIAQARAFVADDYVRALYAGDTLTPETRSRVADRLAALTGLSRQTILTHNLRITTQVFADQLLGSDGTQLGLYDARFTLPLAASGGDPVADDPAMGQYVPAFVATLHEYMRHELAVDRSEPYNAIEFAKVNSVWDYGQGPGVSPNTNFATDLAVAMRRNPAMQLFVGTGYYDLVTTMGAADYTLSHAGIDAGRVRHQLYPSGHMPYIGAANRRQVAGDLRRFIREASAVADPARAPAESSP